MSTRTPYAILVTNQEEELRSILRTLWAAFLNAYDPNADTVQTIHPSFIQDLYPWCGSAKQLAGKLNITLTMHGYDIPVRIFLHNISRIFLHSKVDLFNMGPLVKIDSVQDLMMTESDSDALNALTNFFTNLHHLGFMEVPHGRSAGISALLVLKADKYSQTMIEVARFLRENER